MRGQHKHGRSRETPQQQAPPDIQTGQSAYACLRRELPADHEAHSRPQRGQLRRNECKITLESCDDSHRALAGSRPGGRSGNTTIQSRRVHDRGKPSRAKLKERCRTPFCVQTFEAKTPTTRRSERRTQVDHTWHGGNHDHADGEVANRTLDRGQSIQALKPHGVWRGGERSSSARAKTQHVSEHAERERIPRGSAREQPSP